MAERGKKEAFVTLATNDTYALGCLVVGNSLRRVKTSRQLVIMVTDDVSGSMRSQLQHVFDMLYDVNLLDSQDATNLQLLGRPDLNVTFTKFHCWRLTMFDKAVFLDADTLVLQNVDELFDREELSAAPDAGWPDCFNSGVFVFRPSQETYNSLLDFAVSKGSFDGGDQGLLNIYFRDWATKDIARHLPFIYNVVSQAFYSYLPAFTHFKQDVKIVHFIGATKPWHHPYNTSTRHVQPLPDSGHSQEFLQQWWDIFMSRVQPALDPSVRAYRGESRDIPPCKVYRAYGTFQKDPQPHSTIWSLFFPMCCDKFSRAFTLFFKKGNVNLAVRLVQESSGATSVLSVFPYIHPHVDGQRSDGHAPQIVNIDIVPRQYLLHEAHYSENPMSVINPDAPPTGVDDISQVVKGWSGNDSVYDPSTDKHSCDSGLSTSEQSSNSELSAPDIQAQLHHMFSGGDGVGGLVGSLASMSIQSDHSAAEAYSEQHISDQERKLNWEKGQMDYLGADAFENIQKKLDETLQAPAAEETVSTSSPFSTKSKTSEED